jgi:hypothetical protein
LRVIHLSGIWPDAIASRSSQHAQPSRKGVINWREASHQPDEAGVLGGTDQGPAVNHFLDYGVGRLFRFLD